MPLNDSNFLMWFGPNESPTAPPLPRPFVLEPDVLSPVVWAVPKEEIVFYVNSTNNTAPPNVDLYLEHERSGADRHDVTNSVTVIEFPSGQHAYGRAIVPQGLSEGFVRFVLGDTYRSQWLWLTNAERAATCTSLVTFSNSGRRLQNIRYGYLPQDYAQQFRIRLAVDNLEPSSNKEVYRESDTGKTRHLYSEPRMVVNFLTPEYDYWGHRAIVSMIEHNNILIDGKPFAYQSAYKANMNRADSLSEGQFGLTEELYSTLHR